MAVKTTLTPKQRRFCREYIVDYNCTQAAKRSGYSEKTAYSIGNELLNKPEIKAEIQRLLAPIEKKLEISAEKVLQELAACGYSRINKFTSWGPNGVVLKDSSELEDYEFAAVAEVSETVSPTGGSTVKFKLHDKIQALTQIGRHLALFHDKLDVTTHEGLPARMERARARIKDSGNEISE